MSRTGLWLPPDQDPRHQPAPPRGERECVLAYLEHYRTTLELKCQGLTNDQLATRAVPPSAISLLGLIRHLARVEHSWSRRVIEGQADLVRIYPDDAGFEFGAVTDDLVADAWQTWRAEVAHARAVVDQTDFDTLVRVRDETIEVRDVVVHLVEEYARHCGHADLVREVIDGRTGS